MRLKKRVRPMIDFARDHGFSISFTRNKHLKFSRPGCKSVFSSSTPSDHRTIKNTIAQLRKSLDGRL